MSRFGWSTLLGASVAVVLLVFSAAAGAQTEVQHGIGFTKGCTSPVKVGDPYACSYTVRNILDQADDTLTIDGLVDIVHAAPQPGGDVNSGNILGLVEITTTLTPTGAIPSGATCVASGGTGVFPTPYTGVTSCTLPVGSRVNVLSFSHYQVQAGDFGLLLHRLRDDAFLTWHDLCNDPAGTGNTNCDPNPTPTSASSLATVTQLTSQTATAIHDAGHQVVTTVDAGATVHDFVTVTGEAGKATPTGNVTIDWFLNGDCTGAAAVTSAPIALDAAGQVDATGFSFTVNSAGMRAFMAHYAGDAAYTGSDGPCEPLQILGGGGQITPTQVSCQDFIGGSAPTLDQVNYSVGGNGKIHQSINPGVFFYWTEITTTVPNQVVTTSQTNTSTNNSALFKIHQDWQRLYTGNCSSWTAGTQIAGGTGASFTVPTPGTYVIGIKYDVKSLAGTTPPVPADITFDFATSLGGNTGASVLLKKK